MTITDEAIDAAVKLSARYIADRYLPDKAIDLIDEAASRVRLRTFTAPAGFEGAGEENQATWRWTRQPLSTPRTSSGPPSCGTRRRKLQDQLEKRERRVGLEK